jgi:pyruvate,water dikinase
MKPVALREATDEGVFGGKAVQLGAGIRAGLPVPGGTALPARLVEAVAAGDVAAMDLLAEVGHALEGPLAVRSSAVGEDSEQASFAGQHVTRLNVHSGSALAEAVCAIWESARSDSALAYRRRLGITDEPRIGVVVQTLVAPDVAGVLFTQNPLDGADERVIEATWGLGEAVVAGLVTPDRYRVSREGTVIERVAGAKSVAIRSRPDGGTIEEDVAAERASVLCLEDGHLHQLHDLATRCEKVFGGTQDLEWAFAGEMLYLLQRRAITRGAR